MWKSFGSWRIFFIKQKIFLVNFLVFNSGHVKSKIRKLYTKGLFIWGELAPLHGLAWLGEVIFISRSCWIFYHTAKSLLRHCKKNALITWHFHVSGKYYIFNMDSNNFIRLQQFHFTVDITMNMIAAFSVLLELHGILLILVVLILDFIYLVGTLRSHVEIEFGKNSKNTHKL